MGAGIFDDAACDTQLRIVEKCNTWIAGNRKIEFMIWSRMSGEETSVRTIDFKITE